MCRLLCRDSSLDKAGRKHILSIAYKSSAVGTFVRGYDGNKKEIRESTLRFAKEFASDEAEDLPEDSGFWKDRNSAYKQAFVKSRRISNTKSMKRLQEIEDCLETAKQEPRSTG